MEGYIPNVLRNLDLFWPGRPRTIVVTDGDWDDSEVIRRPGLSFVELLEAAVAEVRHRVPSARHVFLMLEDLCPLAPVDEVVVAQAQDLLRSHDKKFMAMIWPCPKGGPLRYGEWEENGVLKEGPVRLVKFPQHCEFKNSLVSATWEIQHLEDVIADKRAKGISNPWEFETPAEGDDEDHYMFEGIWPTWKDGFSARGKINGRLVTRQHLPNSPLLSQLRRQYCGFDSYIAAGAKYTGQRLGRSLAKRFKSRPGVTPGTQATSTEVSE